MGISFICIFLISLVFFQSSVGVELTFEIAEDSRECFYETAREGSSVTLEYQVVAGGSYDVDVTVSDPARRTLYQQHKSQYDSVTFTAAENGTYVFCFGNEFSTFSHKLVYMDLEIDDHQGSSKNVEHTTVMTQLEYSAQEIYGSLKTVLDYQTHHRLREAQSRKRAEELKNRVCWWSFAETVLILFVSASQVYIVKKFFTYRNHLPFVRP